MAPNGLPGIMLPMKVIVDPQKDAFIQFVESPKNKETRAARKDSSPCAIIPTGFGKDAQDRCIAASRLALDQSHRRGLRPRTYSAPQALSTDSSAGGGDSIGLRTRGQTVGDLTTEGGVAEEEFDGPTTTVMLRNLPQYFTRATLLELIDKHGFHGSYDFVYLPTDFNSQAGLGYAFVNMITPADAEKFWAHFDNFSSWLTDSDKVCSLGWSRPHQGLNALIERYRNSPVMHESLPDECKPMVFVDGVRVPFPPPTRHVKWPRPRSTLSSGRGGDASRAAASTPSAKADATSGSSPAQPVPT